MSFWAVLILVFETSMLVLERQESHSRRLRPSGGAFLEDMEEGPRPSFEGLATRFEAISI